MKSIKTILPLAAFAGLALSANAAVTVINPTSYTQTGEFSGSISQSIDGSGLSGGGTSGDILSETHPASASGTFALISVNAASQVTFALAAPSTVNQVHFWLYNAADWGSVTAFDLEFTTTTGTVAGPNVAFNTALDLDFVQTVGFAEQTNVTHIKLSNMTFEDNATWAGWNEIRFGHDPVPEPSTAALLGLGGLSLILRRRK